MSLLTFFWSRAEKLVHVKQADADGNVDHPAGFDKLGTHTVTAETEPGHIFQAIHSLLARFGGDHVSTNVVFTGEAGISAPITVSEGISGNVSIKAAAPNITENSETTSISSLDTPDAEGKQAVENEQQNPQDTSNDAEKAASLDAVKSDVTA